MCRFEKAETFLDGSKRERLKDKFFGEFSLAPRYNAADHKFASNGFWELSG